MPEVSFASLNQGEYKLKYASNDQSFKIVYKTEKADNNSTIKVFGSKFFLEANHF